MKKIIIALLITNIAISISAQIWVNTITSGRPISSTFYVGDQINPNGDWFFNFEIGQASWNASEVGIGQNTDGITGWNFAGADWYQDGSGSGSNKHVRRNIGAFRFTASGTWYVVGRARTNAGDAWTWADEGSWTNNTTLTASTSTGNAAYFTVSDLLNPTVGTNTVAQNSITLNWTKWNSKNVMIVRYARGATPTAPTGGTAYSVGNTLGSGGNQGTVVYNGSGTSTTNNVSPSTNYDYYFYSENWSYYSAGVKAELNAAAINAPSSPTVSVSGTTAILGWTKNAAANDVMIVRYAKDATPTAPTQGTAYNVNNTLGSGGNQGTVIYRGGATTTTNAIVVGNGYDYYFYSENWSYYSTGEVKASISPMFYRSTGNVTFTTAANWESATIEGGSYSAASLAPNEVYLQKITINTGHVLSVNSAITTPASANFIVNGTLQISTGGSVTTAPTYGTASTLSYSTAGNYTRANEWTIATSGAGYPNNIVITNNTTLNGNIGNGSLAGNLTINSGSSLFMDWGSTGNSALNIGGNFEMAGNLSLGQNLGGGLTLKGNWNRTGGTFNNKSRTVTLDGTSQQNITSADEISFYNLTVNNAAGININSPVTITNNLTLTNGIVNTSSTNILHLTNTHAENAITGGSATAHINGPLRRSNGTLGEYKFPLGKNGVYLPASIRDMSGSSVTTAEAFNANNGGTSSGFASNTTEYWQISANSAITARVSLAKLDVSTINTIGYSSSVDGEYTDLGAMKNSNLIGTNNTLYANTASNLSTHNFYVLGTLAINHFRLKAGPDLNWNNANSWEKSIDNASWTSSDLIPSSANSLSVLVPEGRKVIVNSSVNNTQTTINGTLEIQANGYVLQAPTYGNASTLIYNTGGEYNRAVEWSANTTLGAGYPNNVVIKGNGTQLRMGASKDYKYNASGTLTIEAGTTFDTRIGTPAETLGDVAITFIGDINNNGTIQWGSGGNMAVKCASLINNGTIDMYGLAGGADFQLTGNLTNNATLNYNGRAIIFVGNGNTQTIGGTSADPFEIPFVVLNNPNGTLVLNKSIVAKGYSSSGDGWWAIDIQNGTLDLNGHSITVGEADKIGNIRTATDGKIKGNVDSNITIFGKKNGTANGTLRIDNSNPGSSNVFNSFVYERTDGDNNFVITGNMTFGNLLDIKRGSVQALNNVELLAGAIAQLSSTNTSAALTVDNLILGKSSSANAQFYRNGRSLTLNGGGKVKIRVSFDQTGKWHFFAFPFAISAVEKSDGTTAILGTDYTLGQYNATKRAQRISGWESSTDNPMTALKGYIINRRNTAPANKDLYFVTNEAGTHASFGSSNNLPLAYTTHSGGLNVNFGWNFVAHPLVANGQSTLAAGEFHYAYDGATDQYSVGFGASGERRSFDAYFIKTAAPGSLTVNLSAPQGAPRRTTRDGGTFQLALQHNNMQYRSHIRMHEAATFAYDELYDAPYSTPWNATTARFYSFAGNETMALNTVNGEGEIQLGARFPIKGNYKISWAGNMPGYIAQLIDTSNGELTDMRYSSDYSFEANAGDTNNRFKILLTKDISTNVKIFENSRLSISTMQNTVLIDGIEMGDKVKLYDNIGREIFEQIALGNKMEINGLQKAIYIINIEQKEGSLRRKVVVR